jgi:hypothetical protein
MKPKGALLFHVLLVMSACALRAQVFYPTCSHSAGDTSDSFTHAASFSKSTEAEQVFWTSGVWTLAGHTIPSNTYGKEFKALVIYIRFPGDTATSPEWPDTAVVPPKFESIVDPPGTYPWDYTSGNLSTFFWENSIHKMKLVGDVYYVTLDYDETWYRSHYPGRDLARGAVCRDALVKLDPTVDYRQYDNLATGTPLYVDSKDGEIDNVWFMLRNYRAGDDTSLAFNGADANMYIDGGSITLDSVLFRSGSGSACRAITCFDPNFRAQITIKDNNGPTYYGIVAHELSHHLWEYLGKYHIGDGHSNSYDRKTNVNEGDFFTGYAMNSACTFGSALGYEKWRVGWFADTAIKYISSVDSETVFDLLQIDDSLSGYTLVSIYLNEKQRIVLESRGYNHFDCDFVPYHGPHASMPRGVLAYNIIEGTRQLPDTKCAMLPADGNYGWRLLHYAGRTHIVDGNNRLDPVYDLIDQDMPNPYNGYSDRSRIHMFDSAGQVLKEPDPSYTREYLASYFPTNRNIDCSGGPYPKATNFLDYNTPCADNVSDRNDLFSVGSVISPFSNPPTRVWNTADSCWDTAWVAIRVVSFDSVSKVYRLEVARRGKPLYENMPPARPQRVRLDTSAVNQCPALQWDPNGEPGMAGAAPYNGRYEIQRTIDGGGWTFVDTVQHPVAEYADSFGGLGDGIHAVEYRVRAIDNRDSASAWSLPATVHVAVGNLTEQNAPHVYPHSSLLVPSSVYVFHGMTFRDFVRITFCPDAVLYHSDSLILRQVETDKYSHIVAEPGGVFVIDTSARVDKLNKVEIQANASLIVRDCSITRMSPQGQISLYDNSTIDAAPETWARFETSSTEEDWSRYWWGIAIWGAHGNMQHLFFHDGYPAVSTEDSTVSISQCSFSRNPIAMMCSGDNPTVRSCVFRDNPFSGLYGYHMSKPIIGNRFTRDSLCGVMLDRCSNTWFDNKIDSNMTGVWGIQLNDVSFNQLSGQGACDTTIGNGIRYNTAIGARVSDVSYFWFTCDNSVHDNGDDDFSLEDSDVQGVANFPEDTQLRVSKDQSSLFSWLGPYAVWTPVLLKGSSTSDFNTMMSAARQHHRQRNIVPAFNAYRNALSLAADSRQVRKALSGLSHLTRNIRSGQGFPWFNRTDSLEEVLRSQMIHITQDTSRSPAIRAAAKESLGHFLVQKGQHAAAATIFAELSASSAIDASRKPRMLYDLIAAHMLGLHDAPAARSVYQTLEFSYPNAMEIPLAKVLLHMPLTQADVNLLKGSAVESQRHPSVTPVPTAPFWSRAYPNPFNPVTTIEYRIPERCVVQVEVFSSTGLAMGSIDNGEQESGIHRIVFDGSALPSGAYHYRIHAIGTAGQFAQMVYGTLVLIK